MKSLFLLPAAVIGVPFALAESPREQAEELVGKAMQQAYRRDYAQLWESFSESSRDRFRLAWLAKMQAMQGDGKKQEPEVPEKIGAEHKRFMAHQLTSNGFEADLAKTAALRNRDFWETYLSDRYLKDRDYHAPSAAISAWRTDKLPPYAVEAVAEEGGRLFIVITASPMYQWSIVETWKGMTPVGGFGTGDPRLQAVPPERIVWTASKDPDGKLRLDVPDVVVKGFEQETALRKIRAAMNP